MDRTVVVKMFSYLNDEFKKNASCRFSEKNVPITPAFVKDPDQFWVCMSVFCVEFGKKGSTPSSPFFLISGRILWENPDMPPKRPILAYMCRFRAQKEYSLVRGYV